MRSSEWSSDDIKAWRKRMGWTQTEAGEHLGSRKEYISKLERGVATPSDMLVRLCKCLEENKNLKK